VENPSKYTIVFSKIKEMRLDQKGVAEIAGVVDDVRALKEIVDEISDSQEPLTYTRT
jgi:hypothetical protein